MAELSKTDGLVVLPLTSVTHPGTVEGIEQNVSTKFKARIYCYHAPVENAANTNPGKFLIQTNPFSSGNNGWVTEVEFIASESTPATEAMTETEPAGETNLAVASDTGFVADDEIYIKNQVLANSEFAMVKNVVTNAFINLIDGLSFQQDSNSVIWGNVDKWVASVDLTDVKGLRVLFQHQSVTGVNADVLAMMVTGDSIE